MAVQAWTQPAAAMEYPEYFLFDPLGEYWRPRLQEYCLAGSEYERIVPGADGALSTQSLGLSLKVEQNRLRWIRRMGEPLLPRKERAQAEQMAQQLAEQRAQAEIVARQEAEDRARAAEAGIERLRAGLARLQRGPTP